MITKKVFDKYDGKQVNIYELANAKIKVGIIDFGCAIQYIKLSLPIGERDVCLGFDNVKNYISSDMYCGATIGRVANRIAGATFKLNGKTYNIPKNDGDNCNHGGTVGFDKKFYDVKEEGDKLIFSLLSPDGDMGFDGNLNLNVEFTLEDTSLKIVYKAKSDKDTLFAPTCHTYFNLDGNGDIYDTQLKINADKFTPITPSLIPTGEIASVKGTPFDFTQFKTIGRDIDEPNAQLKNGSGYDHNFVLNSNDAGAPSAIAVSRDAQVELILKTDLPGLQLYTGNFIKGVAKSGKLTPRQAFCLEPQFFPNAVNTPTFPTPILKSNTPQTHHITYTFKF